MKHSIRRQFAFIFTGLMAGMILLCWLLNSTLLEKYYILNKQDVLLAFYDELQDVTQNDKLGAEETGLYLQQYCEKHNMSYLVLDANSRTLRASGADADFMRPQLLDHVLMQMDGDVQVMRETDQYVLQRVNDMRSRFVYIEIWGILDDGSFFIARSALEGIRDSVTIANRFLMYIGVLAMVSCGIIIWVVSRKITDPILELADISQRMTNLDFEARYTGKNKNEIALLGANINQLSDTLEKTISELKTANNELLKDIEKIEKTDEMRREFIANVSHELKTPIALIQGYAEGLLDGISEDPESRAYYCEVIVDEASKMNQMVKKLLTLNQLEFGNEKVAMERFDITSLVSGCLQSAELLANQNEITVKMEETPAYYVWGDEFRIEEVFMNYFSNAVNHCRREKIIEVLVQPVNERIRVTVFNTGEPIPQESLPLIWDKFYKVDKARTREYGGSGVGLSIVRAIMESVHQPYGVQNYENGVAFWFELEQA
ncbi:MAG: HAMP domain-containing protein [Lachnospiraceae bacterium]|nr:HAMP domain-containing protein [Lachnospiraceae bacterium]